MGKSNTTNKPATRKNSRAKIDPETGLAQAQKDNIPTKLESSQLNGVINGFVLEIMKLGKGCNLNDPDDMMRCFLTYVKMCEMYGMKITNQAAYLSMGISRQYACELRKGVRRAKDPRYKELIEQVDMICSTTREVLMSENAVNPITAIWWQKNYDKMTDVQQVEVTTKDPLGEQGKSAQEIADKYKDLLEG